MYKDFIKEEKEFGKRFLKNNQIIEDRFDEEEYSIVKKLFDDGRACKILKVIEDLLEKEKLKNISKYIVLADFIFSMTSFNIEDPSNLVLKTSRNDYFKRINERAEINRDFGYDMYRYIYMHKKLLLGLRWAKIIEKSAIRIRGNEWETIIYFKLNVKGEIKIPLGFCNFPFIISVDKKYSIGSFRNVWILKRKKREMEDFQICTKSVVKSNNLMFCLDKYLYDINLKLIESEKRKILKKCECNSVDEYLKKLYLIVNDDSYNKDIKNREEVYKSESNVVSLKVEIKKGFKNIIKTFQELIPFIVLNSEIIGKKYYLPCFIDNRGRQYYATLLSPTFYKLFRYLYSLTDKKDFIKLEESKFYNIIMKYNYTVKNYKLNERKSYFLIILFIEIGKHFIKDRKDWFISTDEIIKLGIENYNKEKNLKFEEMLYIQKIENEIDKLLENKDIDINTLIFKDATASGLQNYGILMGYKKEKLKYLNLDGNDWCDTYQYLIKKFLDKEEKYNKRKYWKSTIMTIPYNAVWFSCFTKFIEKIREDGIEYNDLEDKEKELLKKMHRKFYDEIKNNVKKEFFGNKKTNFIDFKYKKWNVSSEKEYKVTYKKLRDKYKNIIYDIVEDIDGSLKAREANNMHYLDAKLIKKVIEKFDILPIHDCFGIRLCELHLVIDEINKYYSKIIKSNTYGLHVII